MPKIFQNKHVKVALFLAPFLLIAGYIIADFFVADDNLMPSKNKANQLKIGKNCKLKKAHCPLSYKDLKLELSIDSGHKIFFLTTNKKIKAAMLSVNSNPLKERVYSLIKKDDFNWQITIEEKQNIFNQIHLVVEYDNSLYYVELDF
jgi:hypothetical protein